MSFTNFVIYRADSGEIFGSGRCAEEDIALQNANGGTLLEGDGNPETHYVLDGEIVAYTPEQAAAKAARLSFFHQWSNDTFEWVDPRTQQQIDQVAAEAVRVQRNQLLTDSDWTDTLSSKSRLGDVLYQLWQDYRQMLRDVPQQAGFPNNVVWPEPPQ